VVESTLDVEERIGMFFVGFGVKAMIARVSDGFEMNETDACCVCLSRIFGRLD